MSYFALGFGVGVGFCIAWINGQWAIGTVIMLSAICVRILATWLTEKGRQL